MIGIALMLSLVLIITSNADRAITAILFNTAITAIPFSLGLLFIDYALTLVGRHSLMKYFYLNVVLVIITSVAANLTQIPAIRVVYGLLYIPLGISIISILVMFFRYAFISGHEDLQANTPHVMDKLANAYQKQKANPKSWEEQSFDFFATKLGNMTKRNNTEEEKVDA